MIPDPSTIRLIHLHMIQDELKRQGMPRQHRDRDPSLAGGPARMTRMIAAQALHALARRIDPGSRPPAPDVRAPDGVSM